MVVGMYVGSYMLLLLETGLNDGPRNHCRLRDKQARCQLPALDKLV